jgi:SAM-dependent methyltransferase
MPRALRARLFAGNRHACPICGARLRVFLRLNRPTFRWCPVCRSLQRHRLVWLLMERRILPRLAGVQRPAILHFAPEGALAERLRDHAGAGYVSMDRYDRQAMVLCDICAIPLATAAVDLVYCSHVLEHVEQDDRAMGEMRRALRTGGVAVILVPLLGERTFEDPRITDPVERERVFGQHDHVRWYGDDIRDRLAAAGLAVDVLRTEDIATSGEIERFGLDAGETIFVCTGAAGEHSHQSPA